MVNNLCSETPLCTGSYTLEAAVVIPLVTGFWLFLLFFFRIMQVQTGVYSALSYSSRKTAAIASQLESQAAALAAAEVFFRKTIAEEDLVAQYVEGGSLGITLLTSDCSGEYIDLKAYYRMKFPIGFFSVKGITLYQESRSKKWTGQAKGQDEEASYVYVTEYGEAYHRTKDCSYLDLSVKTANVAQIGALRNKSGHKYYPCELCAEEISVVGDVYITDYGASYHGSIGCSGLKRTIYVIKLSDVEGRHPCKKCAAGSSEVSDEEE